MQQLVDAIYKTHEDREAETPPRGYLGGSMIGHECARFIWLSWRHAFREQIDGRMLRLFQRGHREEDAFISELTAAGFKVYQFESDGSQFGVEAINGHLKGHLDGVITGVPGLEDVPHLLEFKTYKASDYNKLEKVGSVEEHKPQHYAQMQVYMGLMELPAAIYLAVCKDDDRIYCERVEFNQGAFDAIMDRARTIIESKDAPDRISETPTWWKCKWCPAHALCHGGQFAQSGCRTCCHSTPGPDGEWGCVLKQKRLSFNEQLAGCDQHIFLPGLMHGEHIDAKVDAVTYQHPEATYTNGAGGWLSRELAGLKVTDVDGPVGKVRKEFDGEVVGAEATE